MSDLESQREKAKKNPILSDSAAQREKGGANSSAAQREKGKIGGKAKKDSAAQREKGRANSSAAQSKKGKAEKRTVNERERWCYEHNDGEGGHVRYKDADGNKLWEPKEWDRAPKNAGEERKYKKGVARCLACSH